jgi:peptide/nickel transport system permease protein
MRGGEAVESGGSAFFTAPRTAYGRELIGAVPRLRGAARRPSVTPRRAP